MRKILDNPPFSRQILLRISDKNPLNVRQTAQGLGELLKQKAEICPFQVLGPTESPVQKVNNRFYWQILLKSRKLTELKRVLTTLFWSRKEWKPKGSTRNFH